MSSITYAIDGDRCFIKMCGDIRHPQCVGFDALVQGVCIEGGPKRFLVDLTETAFMDSTILGVLARIASWALARGLERPVLAGPCADLTTILNSMGFDRYFAIGNLLEASTNASLNPPPVGSAEDKERARLVLEAHRELMAMNEKNRETFRDVVELLEKGLD